MTRKEKTLWAVGGTGVIVYLALQFLPVWWLEPTTSLTNPPVLAEIRWNSPDTAAIVERACYMCHSNETHLPPYMQVAPLSWIAAQRVNMARTHLNFSEQSADEISVDDLVASIEDGSMPPAQYLLLHPEAQLSETEKVELISGIRITLSALAKP
jgi:hypothetical protein